MTVDQAASRSTARRGRRMAAAFRGVVARLGFARRRIRACAREMGLRRPPPLRQAEARVLAYMIKAARLGRRALPRRHPLHLRPLLHGRPVSLHVGARGSGESGEASNPRRLRRRAGLVLRGLRTIPRQGRARRPRPVLLQPSRRRGHHLDGDAGDGVARLRGARDVAADRVPDRDHLGATAALAGRPGRDGLRPDRDLRAPALDRLHPLVRLRAEAGLVPDQRLLRRLLRRDRVRRPRTVGVPHVPALAHVRVPLRSAVRADDPRQPDRDDE